MAGNEVRINLSTYLKDNGITATRDKVNELAGHVERVNRRMQDGADKAAEKIGKLPGAFGKIQDAVGGVGAKVLSVFAAWKLGNEIGEKIFGKLLYGIIGMKDPVKELAKEMRALRREAEAAAARWEETLAKWSDGWNREVAATERARQGIEDMTQAYIKMQDARERIQSAEDDAAILKLQTDKYNAMVDAETPEEAAAAGKYHDILIAEEEAKQKLAKFDRDAEMSAVKQAAAEEELNKAVDKRSLLKRQMLELDRKLDYLQSQQSVKDMGFAKSNQEEEKLIARKNALERQIEAAERDVSIRTADLDAMGVAREAEAAERKNIEDRAELEVAERKKAYLEYVDSVERADAEAAQREWERRQEEARKVADAELRERKRIEDELVARRINDLRVELAERRRMEGDARSRQNAADAGLTTAWGWYRDKERMQGVIDERKAQADAELQWRKDFDRLKSRRRDWRTAEFGTLSASDEAVRQVAFAKEERAAADRAAVETAENTRQLAEKLDALLEAK